MFLGKYHFHRVVVVDKDQIVNIITQSAVVRAMHELVSKDTGDLAAYASRSLAELGLAEKRKIWSVALNSRAVEAFNLIYQKKVTGVPVVDAEGRIVGNVSARDIRALVSRPAVFERIFDKTSAFLKGVQGEQDLRGEVARPPAVCLKPTDSLATLLKEFVTYKIHRIYLVDDESRPIGVVSLSDVLSAFVNAPDAEPHPSTVSRAPSPFPSSPSAAADSQSAAPTSPASIAIDLASRLKSVEFEDNDGGDDAEKADE